jgi:hypothetical protein
MTTFKINARPRVKFTLTENGLAIGLPGLSAYEVWLKTNPGKTESEYLAAIKGDKGDAFIYSDFTPEQIEGLKVKGDKGDTVSVNGIQHENGNIQITADNIPETTKKFISSEEKLLIQHENREALNLVSGNNTGDETNESIIEKIGFTPEDISKKNQANGYAPLDAGGKVPIQNLPSTLLIYQSVWDASSNDPALLAVDLSKKGFVYNVSTAGTQFGINFKLGDWLIYNNLGVAEKSDNSDDVTSVNGKQGNVTLNASDIAETSTLKWLTSILKTAYDNVVNWITTNGANVLGHLASTANPHNVTKSQVGLSEVDNTSDLNKPLSIAQQSAFCWYGIQWDVNVSSPACVRIGNMEYHRELPIQSLMRGCLLKDDGTVNYYLDSLDWTKKADGTASILDGTDGQVMVEIPSHYRKFESFLSLRKCKISPYAIPGFAYVPKFYIGAYEAAVQRSTSKLCSVINTGVDYRGGNNNAAWDGTTKTLIGRPATAISRTTFRTYARNRGSVNWNMITYDAYKSLFWLYFVEYGNLNSQAAINAAKDANGGTQGGLGNGVTNLDSTKWNTWNSYYPFIPCGQTNSLGNYSGEVSFSMPPEYDAVILTVKANRYRGVENPFGHIYKWTDGINVETHADSDGGLTKLWLCSDPNNFQDNNYNNYSLIGNLPRADGYIKEMLLGEIMPSNNVGGGSGTYFCDYSYITNLPASGVSLRGVFFGGTANHGAIAGFACSRATDAPSTTAAILGSRLCFLGA